MTDLELMKWALDAIEQLDHMGRTMLPDYQMPPEDNDMKHALRERVEELEEEANE